MSAQPAAALIADRAIAGSTAAAQWAQLQADAPQVVTTMQRYLRRLVSFQAPTSVDVAENSLRQFAWWLVIDAALDTVEAVRRDDIVVVEVMVQSLDRAFWADYRRELERLFHQDEIIIRAQTYEAL